MKQIKPIEYEKLISKQVDQVYINFFKNAQNDFEIPKNITDFYENNKNLTCRQDIEKFGVELDKTFGEWKPKQNQDSLIIINHLLSILQNSVICLISLDANLTKEKLDTEIIKDIAGVDIVVATSVQVVGVQANQLTEKYSQMLKEETEIKVFEKLNNHFNAILMLDPQAAFEKLVENILEFNLNYNRAYQNLSSSHEELKPKVIELFMEYMNAYYLFAFFLHLILIYPLQEGMLNEQAFNNIMSDIKLYK